MPYFPYPNLFDGTLDGSTHINDKFASTEPPKLKFNYFVKFYFRPPYSVDSQSQGGLDLKTNFLAVKQMGRLTPVVNYQDVNYYGYRTKVATKTDYSVINMTLYDDSMNRAHTIVDTYMKAISPLAGEADSGDRVEKFQTIQALESAAHLGVIEKIELLHTSVQKNTTYKFLNPKITNVLMDELDMTVSDVANITMSFIYDGYKIEESGRADSSLFLFDNLQSVGSGGNTGNIA
jgi:hypothetical protein